MCKHILVSILILCPIATYAQSTFGTILGSVKDNSGAIVPKATVKLTDTDENTSRETTTNGNGDYEFVNTKDGHYKLEVSSPGFQPYTATELQLVARQTLRIDVSLQVGQVSSTVEVKALAGVITTDTPTIQSNLDGNALLTLPGNVRGGNGSTSPYALIATLPGVQPDDSGNFSIQGGIQSMSQFSVDGISISNVGGNSPLTEAFPSLESIQEIKVQGVGNTAEYAEVGDVTTISKSGTNEMHGDMFWYFQNRDLNATAFGQTEKPALVGNDFGAAMGGPVLIPRLYNGKNKTFFFGTYEGFRYPRGSSIQNEVPTQALRNGDFSGGVIITDPTTGKPFPNNQIPTSRINSVAQGFLSLYPLPNAGDLNSVHAANYIANRDSSLHSDQYDVRVDHYLTSNMSLFGRWTWKSRGFAGPQNLAVPSEDFTDKYKMLVVSWNWNLRPNLINEFRFGFTLNPFTQTLPFDGAKFTNSLGLVGVGPTFPFNGLPDLNITGYTGLNTDRGNSVSQNNTYQWNNNTTWTVARHTMKFGFDIRKIKAVSALGFLSGDNYGQYNFSGSFTGDPFADFLLGFPHDTAIDQVKHDNYGLSMQYALFVQDAFHVSSRLTLEYGLRWEYHPGYTDQFGNIGNFDPSVAKSGLVVYPNGAESTLAPGFLQSFDACPQYNSTTGPSVNGAPCTPVFDASHAHLPQGLRTAPWRIVPRFGFAYRPFTNDKTVFRGGFGMFDTPSMGSIYYALTGTLQSATYQFNNIAANGGPIFQWPNIRTGGSGIIVAPYGTAYFGTANDIHWKEPYTMQWNFSIDRDLGFNTGLRVSYIGQGTRDLVYAPNLNQSYYSTTYYQAQPLSSRPFPNWGTVNDRAVGATMNYNSLQAEVSHRFTHGLTFNSSYTFAKNLADNQGPVPDHFADENAGHRSMDLYDLKAEYGPVWGTRKNRWLTTAVYELPFGRGRHFMSSASRLADGVLGGWRLSNIFLWQTGPFETPYFNNGDPSGTGSGFQRPQHVDRIANGSISNPTASQWFNTSAFVCPATPGWTLGQACTIGDNPGVDLAPIGRFGNGGIGVVTGPGTVNLSTSLGKSFAITERLKIKIEGSFTNVLNHVNLADPVNAIDNSSFGQITSARGGTTPGGGSDFGGYRTGQISARIEF